MSLRLQLSRYLAAVFHTVVMRALKDIWKLVFGTYMNQRTCWKRHLNGDQHTSLRRNDGNIEEVILNFFQQNPHDRAKRKLESLEALRKTFRKLEHDVNNQDF